MEAARKAADDLKAAVAVKDDYARPLRLRPAVKEKNAVDIASAAADFPKATDLFTTAAASAREKKDGGRRRHEGGQRRARRMRRRPPHGGFGPEDRGLPLTKRREAGNENNRSAS